MFGENPCATLCRCWQVARPPYAKYYRKKNCGSERKGNKSERREQHGDVDLGGTSDSYVDYTLLATGHTGRVGQLRANLCVRQDSPGDFGVTFPSPVLPRARYGDESSRHSSAVIW